MALGDSYATLAELKARLGITDTADDTKLTSALSAASRWIEKHCRRQFNDAGSATARYFKPGSADVALVEDFSTTSGLIVTTDDDDDGVWENTWSSSYYEPYPINANQDGMSGWPYWQIHAVDINRFANSRRHTLKVTARWGWTAVPDPVHEACLMVGEEVFKLKDAPFGVAGFGEFGAVRVRENVGACKMLSQYRRRQSRVA